jgi:RNA polymerase sigma factor (sigma-70 family)
MSAPRELSSSVVQRLYARSQATRWGLTLDQFQRSLEASVAHEFGGRNPAPGDVERYLSALHLDDLALAAACAAGLDAAWDHFVVEYRPALYRAADAIDPTGGARELADSLYADLFGLQSRDGVRRSLFRYFHGRSRLTTWLRAVLSQRHIDQIRAGRRLEPLPDDDSPTPLVHASAGVPDPEQTRYVVLMKRALVAAVAALAPRDRLRLGCYYAQDLTLAAIGRMLGEHEASVSRHLTRARREIRAAVERTLREEHGMDEPAIVECFRSVVTDPRALDLAELIGGESEGSSTGLGARKNTGQDRSK